MLRHTLLVASLSLLAACGSTSKRLDGPSDATSSTPAISHVDEVRDLRRIDAALSAAAGKKILLVLDIDDTLLTSTTFFGSDKWYDHQKKLPPGDPGLVNCRFDVIALNYEAGTQKATQPEDVGYINQLTVDRILLTSRSWLYRAATVRELEKAGYVLPPMLGPAEPGAIFRWRPSPKDKEMTVSYDRGLFMTTGQDKGKILVDLLKQRGLNYEHVILVDDGEKNINAMRSALAGANVGYHGLWYRLIDKNVSAQEVSEGAAGWSALKEMLRTTFPERLKRFEENDCAY